MYRKWFLTHLRKGKKLLPKLNKTYECVGKYNKLKVMMSTLY